MKRYFIIIILFLSCFAKSYGSSSLLRNYRTFIQQKIDQNIPIQLDTFTDFIDNFEKRLEDESQKFMGLKPYIKNIVTFVSNISLQKSTITENTVPDYNESFTIAATINLHNQPIPIRFTVVSNVTDVESYSFALHIPDDVKIADIIFEMGIFDNFFKNRWVVFTLFNHQDQEFGTVVRGLNIVADSDSEIVAKNIEPEFEWFKKLVGYSMPTIRFSGSVPLVVLGVIPFFVGKKLPEGITFEALRSLLRLRGVINVNKILYNNNEKSGITKIAIDSCEFVTQWGTGTGLREGFDVSRLFSFEFGITTRISTAVGPDIIAYGGLETKPLGFVMHGKVDGEIKNPFGIPWLSLHNMGFDFPLDQAAFLITGIGVRAQAGLGGSRFEVAGKTELGILNPFKLVLHGKAEKIPFAAFTHFISKDNQVFGWLKELMLDHAQISIVCGDAVIAGREFKSGITVLGQVGNSILNKKAGFQLYAYNTGTYYQLFGNGYLPTVETDAIIFEAIDSKNEGPRLEFNYAFDTAFKNFMQAVVKANGRIKIGSFFDGVADIDLSMITLSRSAVLDWKNFFTTFLRKQKLVVKGKLFNNFGAELQIMDSKDKGIYVKIGFSQTLISKLEKILRETIMSMKDAIKKNIESLDGKIESLTLNMDNNSQQALERAANLVEENNRLRQENLDIQSDIKKIPWKEIYKTVPLRLKQGYNNTLIASNADLLNTILMHGAFNETSASTFAHLRKAKSGALSLIDGIAQITSLGVGLLGIEKIEAQGWLQEIMYNAKPLLLSVRLKVMGQRRTIVEVPFDGLRPIESIKNLIRFIVTELTQMPIPEEIIIDIPKKITFTDTLNKQLMHAPKSNDNGSNKSTAIVKFDEKNKSNTFYSIQGNITSKNEQQIVLWKDSNDINNKESLIAENSGNNSTINTDTENANRTENMVDRFNLDESNIISENNKPTKPLNDSSDINNEDIENPILARIKSELNWVPSWGEKYNKGFSSYTKKNQKKESARQFSQVTDQKVNIPDGSTQRTLLQWLSGKKNYLLSLGLGGLAAATTYFLLKNRLKRSEPNY